MSFNILVDENLAYSQYFFGEVQTKAGRKITAQDMLDKDILLIRSVTKVNENLLKNSPVKFIGSATIGIDHLDIDYLNQHQIVWSNAQGCNAQAVAEYVISALYQVEPILLDQPITLGIIGLGHVGSRLARLAKALGWQVKAYDPLKQDFSHGVPYVDFEDILQCDVISLHTPLTRTGLYPTYHLIDRHAFSLMKKTAILVNSARGEVIEEQALFDDINQTHRKVILDVFEYEPNISQDLLDKVTLVTPHIAGYSLEGKARGTEMIYQAFCQHFGFEIKKSLNELLPLCPILFNHTQPLTLQLKQHLKTIYPIDRDNQSLRQIVKNGWIHADEFDDLRKHYPLRREWSAYGFVYE